MPPAVIVDAVRTARGKRKGSLATTHPLDLAAHAVGGADLAETDAPVARHRSCPLAGRRCRRSLWRCRRSFGRRGLLRWRFVRSRLCGAIWV